MSALHPHAHTHRVTGTHTQTHGILARGARGVRARSAGELRAQQPRVQRARHQQRCDAPGAVR